jgi:hypothetical protein
MLPMGMMSPFPEKMPDRGFFVGGVSVYGYRHYRPKTGQFLGRDRIQELGGMNLYGFVGNDGIGQSDSLGMLRSFMWQVLIQSAKLLAHYLSGYGAEYDLTPELLLKNEVISAG